MVNRLSKEDVPFDHSCVSASIRKQRYDDYVRRVGTPPARPQNWICDDNVQHCDLCGEYQCVWCRTSCAMSVRTY